MDGRCQDVDGQASLLELIREAGYGEDELGGALVRLAKLASAVHQVEADGAQAGGRMGGDEVGLGEEGGER